MSDPYRDDTKPRSNTLETLTTCDIIHNDESVCSAKNTRTLERCGTCREDTRGVM